MNIEEFISIINKYIELFTKYSKLMKKKAHSQVEQEEINSTSSLMGEVCKTYSDKLGNLNYNDLVDLRDALLLKLKEINLKIPKLESQIKAKESIANDALKKGDFANYLDSNGIAFSLEDELELLKQSQEAYNLFTENVISWIKLRKPQINGY